MSRRIFNKWLYFTEDITSSLPEVSPLPCPVCGKYSIDFQYVGDIETKIGYLDIWCNECLNGIHISRTKIPENANVLPFNIPKDEIAQRIPNFKQVMP